MSKECFKCHLIKPLSEFYKHNAMADGYLNKCKNCFNKDMSEYRQKNIKYFREYERKRNNLPHRVKARKEYAKTEQGKLNGNKAKKKYRINNPLKYRAEMKLGNAIRDGKIQKQPCEICGSIYRIHGHHEDYYKPLDVNWLCTIHHKERHKQLRAA